ncbi:uncharacterized protein VTP21DRAFT_8037 [Calcarisporiella thermophila]|uniref:uncharacterized protein n=1 Tax=Calcarisporiella thermophila TaxID=911321 RepID=UPI0037435B9E
MRPASSASGRAREAQPTTRMLRGDAASAAESSDSRPADSTLPPEATPVSSQEETAIQLLLKQQSEVLKQQSMMMENMMTMFGKFLEKSQTPIHAASPEYASPLPIESNHSNEPSVIQPDSSINSDSTDKPRRLQMSGFNFYLIFTYI